jgi:hypothetical protein
MAEIATVKVEFDPSKWDALIEVIQDLDKRITILEAKLHEGDDTD